MNAARLLAIKCIGIGSTMYFLVGPTLLMLPAIAAEPDSNVAEFADDPRAHQLYDRMIEAIADAKSLSFTSRYELERGSKGKIKTACTYRVCLKKPNYFRMETQSDSGATGGVLVGDGKSLWIYWPNGRPRWSNVIESEADDKTRLSSYMTKPALQGKHSIWHEAIFLGGGMGFPILDLSRFHGHVDSIEPHLDAVRFLKAETIGDVIYDQIEVSLMDGQRRWRLWLSKRDNLPRKLQEITRVNHDVVTTERWSKVTVNEDIPSSMFAWNPPSNWKEWKLPDERDRLLKPGAIAPDFDLASIDGTRIKLSDFKGKPVLLCFWRVGYPPCHEEMPYLEDIYVKHKDQGLAVLGINVSDDRQITLNFLHRLRITFPNILDTSGAAEKVCFEDYGGGTVPLNYVIDGEGAVVDAWFGASAGHVRAKAALESIGLEFTESSAH